MAAKRQNPQVEQTIWLSLEETAGCLGVTNWTVLRWAKDGDPRLPAYKVWDESAGARGRFRFKKQDVDALVVVGTG
jgi:excisionase family DNA binding protein